MFKVTQLKNGLRVVTIPMKGMHSVSVGMWVCAGGRYESKQLSGISHFIEHLVFKGTKNRNVRAIKEAIEGRGGMLNAFTSEEMTCYFVKILRKHFDVALDLVCDLVKNPLFKQVDIEMERTVILEEIKMYMDLPSHHVHDIMNELLWQGHPLGRSVLGTFETISKMTRNDILAYKKKYYHPKNFVLVASGDIEHEATVKAAADYFRTSVAQPKAHCVKVTTQQKKSQMKVQQKKTEQTHFVVGYRTCSRQDPRRYTLGMMNIILGANMSSRLFNEVREKRGLAYEIRSSLSLYEDTGACLISAGVENGKAYAALQVINRECQKIMNKNVSKGELKRAKDYYLGQLLLLFESTMENMLWFGEKVLNTNSVPSIEKITTMVEKITPDDIRKMACEVFQNKSANFAAIGPIEDAEQAKINALMGW